MEHITTLVLSLITAIIMSVSSLWGQPYSSPAETTFTTGTTTARVVNVIDGDTIEVMTGSSTKRTKVRYIGIDTPEPYATKIPECGSAEATARNKELVANKIVTLAPGLEPYDQYGRLLAYVYVDTTFINELLVREGYATVLMINPNTQYRSLFLSAYTNARTQRLGIWNRCE